MGSTAVYLWRIGFFGELMADPKKASRWNKTKNISSDPSTLVNEASRYTRDG